MPSLPTWFAFALVVVDFIDTGGIVLARIVEALVYVGLAQLSLPAGGTFASEIRTMI